MRPENAVTGAGPLEITFLGNEMNSYRNPAGSQGPNRAERRRIGASRRVALEFVAHLADTLGIDRIAFLDYLVENGGKPTIDELVDDHFGLPPGTFARVGDRVAMRVVLGPGGRA